MRLRFVTGLCNNSLYLAIMDIIRECVCKVLFSYTVNHTKNDTSMSRKMSLFIQSVQGLRIQYHTLSKSTGLLQCIVDYYSIISHYRD